MPDRVLDFVFNHNRGRESSKSDLVAVAAKELDNDLIE